MTSEDQTTGLPADGDAGVMSGSRDGSIPNEEIEDIGIGLVVSISLLGAVTLLGFSILQGIVFQNPVIGIIHLFLASCTTESRREMRLEAERRREQKDYATLRQALEPMLMRWRRAFQTNTVGRGDQRDAVLLIDVDGQEIRVETPDGSGEREAVRLPEGWSWAVHRVTPQGHEQLRGTVRLPLHALANYASAREELVHLQGTSGKEAGISVEFYVGGFSTGTGRAKLGTFGLRRADPRSRGPTESVLVGAHGVR